MSSEIAFSLHLRNGFSLSHNLTVFAIIRHNVRTYRSDGVVEVVNGESNAQLALKRLQECQDSSDHFQGWRYFLEKTDLKAGTDPVKATSLRQTALDARESVAMQDEKPLTRPSSTL